MKNITFVAFIAACLIPTISYAKDFTPAQKKNIEDAVKEKLIDPDSAKFKFPTYKGGLFYCGLVNSKNRYGGYAGFSVFQVAAMSGESGSTSFYVLGVGDGDSGNEALKTTCAEHGYTF